MGLQRELIFTLVVLGLSGCISVGGFYGSGGSSGIGVAVHSQPVTAPVSMSGLRLTRELEIAPGRARAYFQDGKQSGGKDRYRPHCEFEISTVSEQSQQVAADEFAIVEIAHRMVTDENSGVPVFYPSVFGDQDIFYETHIQLASRSQPGVRKLVCRDWSQYFSSGGYLSTSGIQQVLGPTFELQ